MLATCSPSQSIDPSVSSRLTYVTTPQISRTVGQAILSIASLPAAFGMISDGTAAIVSATNPTSTSNASATTISVTMPIRVSTLSRSRLGISPGTPSAPRVTPAVGYNASLTICTGWRASRPTPCEICWRHDTPVAATSVSPPSARSAGNSRDSPICIDSS